MTYDVDFNDLPVLRNVRVMQGDTYRQPYQIMLNEEPLDLTDAQIFLAIRRRPGRGQVLLQRQISPDSAIDGQFTVLVPAEATAVMMGEYWYEVEITWPVASNAFPDGCTKTVLAGSFVVSDDVLD